jgi:hypothetical protein
MLFATSFTGLPSASYETRPSKIDVMILPPPVSVEFEGMSGFWGSEPFVVTIPDAFVEPESPPLPLPLLEQPVRAIAVAPSTARAESPARFLIKVPPGAWDAPGTEVLPGAFVLAL